MGCAVSDDKVLTVRQAARIMERSNSHVCTLARQGELDAKKWGKYWFIDPTSVRRYMDEVAVKPLPEVLDDPEALEKLYHETGTLRNLATEIGCDRVTVRNALCRHDLEIRTRSQVARKAMKEAPPGPGGYAPLDGRGHHLLSGWAAQGRHQAASPRRDVPAPLPRPRPVPGRG